MFFCAIELLGNVSSGSKLLSMLKTPVFVLGYSVLDLLTGIKASFPRAMPSAMLESPPKGAKVILVKRRPIRQIGPYKINYNENGLWKYIVTLCFLSYVLFKWLQ